MTKKPESGDLKATKMDSMADTIVPALSSMRGNVNKMGGQTYDEFIQDPDGVEYHKK